jgi:hypothetical protein
MVHRIAGLFSLTNAIYVADLSADTAPARVLSH